MLELLAFALALIIAIDIHEFAHAFPADRLGDPTPRSQGRLSLNPLAHLDPIGTLMLLVFHFGWGKPVQFDPYNLSNPRRDAAVISLAGPVTNLLLAIITSILIKFIPIPNGFMIIPVAIITLNISLAIFNLVPIHPLDGAKILEGILPRDLAYEYGEVMRQYGTFILIFMILPVFGTSPIQSLIIPIINFLSRLLLG